MAASGPDARGLLRGGGRPGRLELVLLTAILAGAAWLRLAHLGGVAADPYYDSAVRSMGASLHDFLFGALEPGATVSLDKPPIDLWPAVLATKLLGFGRVTLRLPEALAGTAAVGLIYLSLRRGFGAGAALGAAAALAVLPIEVITSRSDTTDAIMMTLTVLALLMVVRTVEGGRTRWLLGAAAVMGVAFNVKLAESWPALLPLAAIAAVGLGRSRRTLRALLGAAGVYVAVALAWLTLTLIVPAHAQPYATGSTNGSPWNAAFVFNGLDRLRGEQSLEGPAGEAARNRRYPEATQAERNAIPITAPSPTRLLARVGPLSGERLGLEALGALLLGGGAFLAHLGDRWRRRGARGRPRTPVTGEAPGGHATQTEPPPWPRPPAPPLQLAVLGGLVLWLVEGIVLFSTMARLHPRYTEAFIPAVAGLLGIGAAWATAPGDAGEERPGTRLARALTLVACVLLIALYAEHLLYGTPAIWWVTLTAGLAAVAVGLVLRARRPALAALLAFLLAIPLWASLAAVREDASDGNVLGALPASELGSLSRFLVAHQAGARFETAYDAATHMGALVMRDGRPVLPLSTVEGHMIVSRTRLEALAAQGLVHYVVLSGACPHPASATDADCSAQVAWVRAHGRDVSAQAALPRDTLWQLPQPSP